MNTPEILKKIKKTESPLKRQLLMIALISNLLEQRGKPAPVVIGGCALAYYSREVYFTADIDLAYADRETLAAVLKDIGFQTQGRYWINYDLNLVIEVPASVLTGEDAPLEIVEIEEGLQCNIIGIEDLIIDRLNSCKHWKYEVDCEMAGLLINKFIKELDWVYLERQAARPENNTLAEISDAKIKAEG